MIKIFPSLMAAGQLNIGHVIQSLEMYCDGFHIDIMDDQFVPNIALSAPMANEIDKVTRKPLSVHLMVENPEEWISNRLHLKKDTMVAFHFESTKKPAALIELIKEKGWRPGIALSPETPAQKIFLYLSSLYFVLALAVEPGFSGQEFLPETFDKIEHLVAYKKTRKLPTVIAADGGISAKNIRELKLAGVEHFCIGSAIFDTDEPTSTLETLYEIAE